MTEDQAIDYMISRGERHGLTLKQVLDMVPSTISDDMVQSAEFVEDKHFSHKLAQSTHPELAKDPNNIILEDPDPNRERGPDPMNQFEEFIAHIDNQLDAMTMLIT